MKYIYAFLFFFTIGIQESIYSSVQNDSINISQSKQEISLIEDDSDSVFTMGGNNDSGTESLIDFNFFLILAKYIFIFILGFICAVIYYNYKISSLLDEEFDKYESEYKKINGKFSFLKIGIIQILKERKDDYKSRSNLTINIQSKPPNIRTVNKSSSFENSVSNTEKVFEAPVEQDSSPSVSWDNPSPQPEKTRVPEEIKPMVLFFSLPDEDGSFSLDNSSISPTSRSYYKVEYTDGDNIGKLIYRSGDLDISALSQMDYILSPVCEIENSSMQNPTVIYVESDGEVIKEGDSWSIYRKIKLKLS